MKLKNRNSESLELEKKKSYPAVLRYVAPEYDPLRRVYSVRFVYELYVSTSQTKLVDDIYLLWDNKSYRSNTINRLINVLFEYHLSLIDRDFRNEQSITNACSWLAGTRVELVPYSYNGIKFKVVSTERKDYNRTKILWQCLREDSLDEFKERLERDEEKW